MINASDLTNYLYCQEYWNKNREQNLVNFDQIANLQRLTKRINQYERFMEIRKRYFTNERVRKSLHKKENMILVGLVLLGIPIGVYLLFQSYVFSLILFLFLLTLWGGKVARKQLYLFVNRKTTPLQLILEERKMNRQLILIDPVTNIYGEIPDIRREKGIFYVTLDRSHIYSHSFFLRTLKSDELLMSIYLHLLKVNFLIPESQLIGEICYKNQKMMVPYSKKSKKIKKASNTIEKRLEGIVKKYNPKISAKFKGLPFRCAQCTHYRQGCEKFRDFPKLKVIQGSEEDNTKTYHLFRQTSSRLLNTNWMNWKKDVQTLVKVLHSSSLISKRLQQFNQNVDKYDIKEFIESAIFHKCRLTNGYLLAKKRELAFSYQLLLYLANHGTVTELKPLMKYYGIYEKEDNVISLDIKIVNFFGVTIRNFVDEIDQYLSSKVPEDKVMQIQQTFNNQNGQMNISFDSSSIQAEMNVNDDDDNDD